MVAVPVARDIMKTTIRVVHPDMSVLAAMHALHSKGENAAMVVDDDFRLRLRQSRGELSEVADIATPVHEVLRHPSFVEQVG